MKKVLFVASVVKLHIMVFHLPYLKKFKDLGYEVHVAAKNDYENPNDLDIPFCDVYHNVDFSRNPVSIRNVKAYKQIKKIIEEDEFEILHCHTPIAAAIARLAVKNSHNNNVEVVYTAHGFHFYEGAPLKNWLFFYPIEKYLSQFTDKLVTINSEDYNLAKNKFYSKNTYLIHGIGLDLNKYQSNNINVAKKRLDIGVPKNAFLVLSVGEVNKNKNHEVIIKAISKLNDSQIHYVICGEGPLMLKLMNLSRKLGLEKQIHFLGFRYDISEICQCADVFAFPSQREGLGMAALEAMATGLPLITSNIHGIKDYSINNVTGFSNNPDDVNSFASNIKELKNNLELKDKMGEYNRKFVQKFSLDNSLLEMGKIYDIH